MAVSALKNDDWQFGRGLATYSRGQAEVLQNVKTRLRSFVDDWYLDTNANIDWFFLLGQKGTKEQIDREIRRVTLTTEGVLSIQSLEFIDNQTTRKATIQMKVTTVFDSNLEDVDFTL